MKLGPFPMFPGYSGTVSNGGSRGQRSKQPLSVTHPELAAEALFDAASVVAGTHQKLPWKCSAGHEWVAQVKSRALNSRGCPYCANKIAIPGVNDLATTHPELAAEALFDASTVTFGSKRKLPWRCEQGHEWEAVLVSRTKGAGCPVCAGKLVARGVNDLATTHPELAAEALFDPESVSAGSSRKVPWRCEQGHEWEAVVANRTAQRQGCPYCTNRRVLPGFNDLATTHPELIAEGLFDSTTVTYGSIKRVRWRCEQGHEWEAPVAARASSGEGCAVCAGKVIVSGVTDLATTHPELAAEALFDSTTVIAGSHRKLPWRCEQGHEWKAQVKSRAIAGRGCPVCGNKKVLPGFNDLATTHPELAAEALFDPTSVTYGHAIKLPWRCEQGHEWEAAPNHRSKRLDGCPVCGNKKVLPGFNDLATTHPHIALEGLFDATEMTAGSHRKVPWRCEQGHEWKAQVKSRAIAGQGCPVCAPTGYDPSEPGWIYLMQHPEWEMLQIGITNHIEQRMKVHTRQGWELLDARGPIDGGAARGWEVSVINHLRSQGVPLTASSRKEVSSKDAAGIVGEAWWSSDYPTRNLLELMEAVRHGEWNSAE